MSSDNRDRFGDKLREAEKAQEDKWARERDAELIRKLREKEHVELHCPNCQAKLAPRVEAGLALLACPDGHGAWLDHQSMEQLEKR